MFKFHKNIKNSLKTTTELSIFRSIIALGFAGIDTIWALYMSSFNLSESMIGFISAGLIIISLLFSSYSTVILETFNEMKILFISLIIFIISYISISFFDNLYFFIGISVILTVFSILRIDSFDILFRDEAGDENLNEEEGILYTLLNISWFLGPLIAGFILASYGINFVFLSSAIFILIGILVLKRLNIKTKKKKREKIDKNIFQNLKEFVNNKKLLIAYSIGAGIEIWYAIIYIYVPLFIIKAGLGEEIVGIFLSLIIVPLVIFEYKISKLTKKNGFKWFLSGGFIILGISGILVFFISNIYYILGVLVLAHIAMAALEPLQDIYFFKQVNSNEEEKFYPIFATSSDLGGFIGKISIAFILLFLPDKFSYLVISLFMFLIAFICLKIKK